MHSVNRKRPVDEPLSTLRGVGPARAALLERKGLHSVLDLLLYVPMRYEDRTRFTPIHEARDGEHVLVRGTVVSGGEGPFRRGRRPVFRIVISDGPACLTLVWFHYRKAGLRRHAVPGTDLMVYGRVMHTPRGRQMAHPDILPAASGSSVEPPGIHPVYSSIPGVPDGIVRSTVRAALDRVLKDVEDPVPKDVLAPLGLPSLDRALAGIHRPSKGTSPGRLNRVETPAQHRLIFDRFLGFMLALRLLREARRGGRAPALSVPEGAMEDVESGFPFRFTPDQATAVRDVLEDLARGRSMNRLVMGDVGCGKTAVAAAAARLCVRNGLQAVIMAPTRILAEQHAEAFSSLAHRFGFRVGLLTGILGRAAREDLLKAVRQGRINLVVGTHALVGEDVAYQRLGLVVIDEQQRFGVRARARVLKGEARPHVLVLTATPIPRTLALAAYGDLDISIIRERPSNYGTVVTRIVDPGEKRALAEHLAERMTAGQQAIVVCPAVEVLEGGGLKNVEEMSRGLRHLYGNRFTVGALHGRMPEEERMCIMDRFRRGDIHLLVTTTVIEVGVHVPNATTMVIEHPERFGLAQLHQLRGRVGRGTVRGTCFLVPPAGLSGEGLERLKILEKTSDGFRIAEQDLRIRGQGQLAGLRQAGPGELDLEEVLDHSGLLEAAGRAADLLFQRDPGLQLPRHAGLRRMAEDVLSSGPPPSGVSP